MRITLEDALELIRVSVIPLAPAKLPLKDTLGLITAEKLASEMDQPPFPRSPYDGYALRAEDSFGASDNYPITLKVVGSSFAGSPADAFVSSGEAVRIMTGGAIPEGADCIIKQENTNGGEKTVAIFESLKPYDNYCHQGEDFHKGDTLAESGIKVTAAVHAVATSAGCSELKVFPKPWISIISTGDELQELGSMLQYSHIYNSNAAYLSSRLKELSVPSLDLGPVCDELEGIKAAIEKALKLSDFIICSGGVSVGQKDLVPLALEQLGAKIIFHGVAIKPGMPAAFAMLQNKPILALSGNPFACAVTFELLARTVTACLASDATFEPRVVKAVLSEGYDRKRPVRRFHRGILKSGVVRVPGEQGNGQLRTMIGCNCLVDLPAGDKPLCAGETVNAYLLEGELYGI